VLPAQKLGRRRNLCNWLSEHASLILDNSDNMTVVYKKPKVGRNAPGPCGSGKKYKKCCLGKSDASVMRKRDEFDLLMQE
jgi:hypothetical protein